MYDNYDGDEGMSGMEVVDDGAGQGADRMFSDGAKPVHDEAQPEKENGASGETEETSSQPEGDSSADPLSDFAQFRNEAEEWALQGARSD